MVYPNQMICLYQDNSHFKRLGDSDFGDAAELYDANLATEGSPLTLKNVIQSSVTINLMTLVGADLVFLSSKTVNNQHEQGYLVVMPLSEMELLS